MTINNSKRLALLLAVFSLFLAGKARATTGTWVGASSAAWDVNGSWNGATFPNSTTDNAYFTGAATVGSLGQAISVSSLTSTGNVSITDSTYALTFASTSSPINIGAGQSLTLNLSTVFAAGTTISSSLASGATLTFGGNSGLSLNLGGGILDFNTPGTIDIDSGETITSGGSGGGIVLKDNAIMNLDSSTYSGSFASNTIELEAGSTLNLQTNQSQKVVLGSAGTTLSESIYITTAGVSDGGIVQVSGAGGSGSSIATIGANIAGGGTATYSHITSLSNSNETGTMTVVFSAASLNTLDVSSALADSTTGPLIVQVSGGGTVDFDATTANTFTTSALANGTEVKATGGDTILELDGTSTGGVGLVALTGSTTVDTGCTIQLLASNQMATAATLTINGAGGAAGTTGALENVSGANTFAAPILLGSASTISSDASTLTLTGGITNAGFLLTFGGAGNTTVSTTAITGLGGLTKSGAGTLTLAASNSYGGTTTVNGGSLFVSGSLSGTGAVNVNSGGTLGGSGLIDGATTVASGATLNPGVGLTTGTTLTINNTVTFNTGSTFTVNIDTVHNVADELTISGASNNLAFNGTDTLTFALVNGASFANLANGTYVIADVTGSGSLTGGGQFAFNAANYPSDWTISYATPDQVDLVVAAAIPEPATWAALLGGMGLLGFYQRLRKRRA